MDEEKELERAVPQSRNEEAALTVREQAVDIEPLNSSDRRRTWKSMASATQRKVLSDNEQMKVPHHQDRNPAMTPKPRLNPTVQRNHGIAE